MTVDSAWSCIRIVRLLLLSRFIRRPAANSAAAAPPPMYLTQRADEVFDWWNQTFAAQIKRPPNLTGLALSGGGIRSATFSLGVIQALARSRRLGAVDILSTVSGGSYIGCFLRSLFLPKTARGIRKRIRGGLAKVRLPDAELADQYDFAVRTLKSAAAQKEMKEPAGPEQVCNPLWWLREHSRYLAPNGLTDFANAAAYLSRNWVGMILIFAVASGGVLAVSQGIEGAVTPFV